MKLADALLRLRDDLKAWVTTNLHAVEEAIKNKKDFSGKYSDLTDAPDISNNSKDELLITDKYGNAILQVNEDGLNVTEVKTNKLTNDSDELLITDDAGNAVLMVDEHGLNTTEIKTNKIVNESNELLVTDAEGNAVLAVDKNGLNTTEIKTKKATTEADEIMITDVEGNAILLVDEHGVTSTEVKTRKLNSDATDIIVTDSVGNTILKVDDGGIKTTEVFASRLQDETDDFVIADSEGNTVLQVDDNGLKTTNVGTERLLNESDNLTISDAEGNAVFKVDGEGTTTTKINVDELYIRSKLVDMSNTGISYPLKLESKQLASGHIKFKTLYTGLENPSDTWFSTYLSLGAIYSGIGITIGEMLMVDTPVSPVSMMFVDGAEYVIRINGAEAVARLTRYDLSEEFANVSGWLLEAKIADFDKEHDVLTNPLPNGAYIESLCLIFSDELFKGRSTAYMPFIMFKCNTTGLTAATLPSLEFDLDLLRRDCLSIDLARSLDLPTAEYISEHLVTGDTHDHTSTQVSLPDFTGTMAVSDLLTSSYYSNTFTDRVTFSLSTSSAPSLLREWLIASAKFNCLKPIALSPDANFAITIGDVGFDCTAKRVVTFKYPFTFMDEPTYSTHWVLTEPTETLVIEFDEVLDCFNIYLFDPSKVSNPENKYNALVAAGLNNVEVTITADSVNIPLLDRSRLELSINDLTDNVFTYDTTVIYDNTVTLDKYSCAWATGTDREDYLGSYYFPNIYTAIQVPRKYINFNRGLQAEINGYPAYLSPSAFTRNADDKVLTSINLRAVYRYNSVGDAIPVFTVTTPDGITNSDSCFHLSAKAADIAAATDEFITLYIGFSADADGTKIDCTIPPNITFDLKLYSSEGLMSIDEAKSLNIATKDFVTRKVAEAQLDGGDVDLSVYATKTEVTAALNKKADTEHTHSTYATKSDVITALDNKVDKEEGKSLSSNDYTDEEKLKLASLVNTEIDSALSETSENPVQNKVIDTELLKTLENSRDYTNTKLSFLDLHAAEDDEGIVSLFFVNYPAPGLYETGTNYTVLKTSWEDLVADEVLRINDGAVSVNPEFFSVSDSSRLAGDLVLPSDGSVTALGDNAFYCCRSLTNLTLPYGITTIGEYAFGFCDSLYSLELPKSLKSIGYCAFGCGCGIKILRIPYGTPHISAGLVELGACRFVELPKSITIIPDVAFCQAHWLETVYIPDSVTFIGKRAFDWSGLSHIKLPNSITTIGDEAFSETELTEILIPASVTNIGLEILSRCKNLKSIEVDSANSVYHATDNCLIHTMDKKLIAGCSSSIIPKDGSVTILGKSAFEGIPITDIIIPEGVTTLEDGVFYDCTSLTSIVIPKSITDVGDMACNIFGYNDNIPLNDIYYTGNEEEWAVLKALFSNNDLSIIEKATVHYNYIIE